MKRLVNLVVALTFAVAVPFAMAQTGSGTTPAAPSGADKPAKTINCCVKGKCEQVKSDADCAKLGGKVVKDCKDCK